MIASYRLQLTPEFDFAAARELLPYLRRLGVSHLYLSPVSQARAASEHGYDVIDHNRVRAEFGGREGFEALREAAQHEGLALILDWVPNHAGVGPDNLAWQDLLAYGPHARFAPYFDVDWRSLKPELHDRVLLPFLGAPYGACLDDGEIVLAFEDDAIYARYYEHRFALAPATYPEALAELLPLHERQPLYFDLKALLEAFAELEPEARDRAEALKARLAQLAPRARLDEALAAIHGERLHQLLERQYWRLASFRTAGHEINYRRFFNINDLVGLRMEEDEVFWASHALLGELLAEPGVDGVRVDHVDGLFDPHGYLDNLAALGARRIWVEKILAPGETLPAGWRVSGTTGYEFMNDALRLLVHPDGEAPLRRTYRRLLGDHPSYEAVVHDAKRLVMTSELASELTRLAFELARLSEADYHTRDFTVTALREALIETIAAFGRYRTYLPHEPEVAEEVIRRAVAEAKRSSRALEPSIFAFVESVLCGDVAEGVEPARRDFVARFQQYTAPVTAKGVEDTAFYRFAPLAALNEVGGEPDEFTVTPQAFHARARYRARCFPETLLATASHDHKRGEDTRMRLAVLAERGDAWEATATALAERFRALEDPAPNRPRAAEADVHFVVQHWLALWDERDPAAPLERLQAYLQKALREGKQRSSWINPDAPYEQALCDSAGRLLADPEAQRLAAPLAGEMLRFGFANTLSQLVLKLTTPGVPDIYRGCELLDDSLVDPDNRRPVDFAERARELDELEPLLTRPDPEALARMLAARDPTLKLLLTARLLRLRRSHPRAFAGEYRALEPEGEQADHLLAFVREAARDAGDATDAGDGTAAPADDVQVAVLVGRFPATLADAGGWRDARVRLPDDLQGEGWRDALSGVRAAPDHFDPAALPLPVAVFVRSTPNPAPPPNPETP